MRKLSLALMVLLVAACSGSGSDDTTTTAPPTSTTVAAIDGDSPQAAGTTPATSSTTTTTNPEPTTTTTTQPRRTTTTTTTPRTTTSTTPRSNPPTVRITTPDSVQRYEATFDAGAGNFGAVVQLAASVSDPDGNPITVEWYSDLHGFLGQGTSLAVRLSVERDTSQPVITAVATDSTGASASASRQVIVWILSDQG